MRAPTLKTRKPVVDLKVSDLRVFPIWEFALDEEGETVQDETWVRPVSARIVPNGAYSQIAATDFCTAAGRKLQGFMIVTTANGQIEIRPGAVMGRIRYRALPCLSRKMAVRKKATWDVGLRDKLLAALGSHERDLFPLQYRLRVPIGGERSLRTGQLS